jgi:hypothetical protein
MQTSWRKRMSRAIRAHLRSSVLSNHGVGIVTSSENGRLMHCFRSAESLERSVQERTVWKTRDQALVASHLVRVRTSIDKIASGEPEPQHTPPSQALNADLMVLTATRKALRAQLCLTRPDRVIDLLNR